MGKLNLAVEDGLEEEFRRTAFQKFGYRKGSLQRALEEALTEWVQRNGSMGAHQQGLVKGRSV